MRFSHNLTHSFSGRQYPAGRGHSHRWPPTPPCHPHCGFHAVVRYENTDGCRRHFQPRGRLGRLHMTLQAPPAILHGGVPRSNEVPSRKFSNRTTEPCSSMRSISRSGSIVRGHTPASSNIHSTSLTRSLPDISCGSRVSRVAARVSFSARCASSMCESSDSRTPS